MTAKTPKKDLGAKAFAAADASATPRERPTAAEVEAHFAARAEEEHAAMKRREDERLLAEVRRNAYDLSCDAAVLAAGLLSNPVVLEAGGLEHLGTDLGTPIVDVAWKMAEELADKRIAFIRAKKIAEEVCAELDAKAKEEVARG